MSNVIKKFSGDYGGVTNFIDPFNAQDGRTDDVIKFDGSGITLDFGNLYAKINGDNPSKALSNVAGLYAYFKANGGDLFSAGAQSEALAKLS